MVEDMRSSASAIPFLSLLRKAPILRFSATVSRPKMRRPFGHLDDPLANDRVGPRDRVSGSPSNA